MHQHVFSRIIHRARRSLTPVIVLLLALGAAACTPDALLSPGHARQDGQSGAPITVTPGSVVVGDTGVVLTVRGSGFTPMTGVNVSPWLGVTTTFVDDSTLTARIEEPLHWAAEYAVVVVSETWEESAPAPFVVANPVPVITRMTPDWCDTGSDCGTVTLEGHNFMFGMRVLWDGMDVNIMEQTSTHVTFTVSPYALQSPALVKITALNLPPTAGPSAEMLFQVGTRFMLHTAGATAGGGGFELEIYGEDFSVGDVVYWNGSPRQTTVYNQRRMSIGVTAADVAVPGENVVTLSASLVNMGEPFRVGTVTVRPAPSATVTSQLSLDLPVRDLAWSPVTNRLYGTVYDGEMAGHLAVIEPSSGAVENYVWVGQDPRYLALSEDGRYLWVGVDGENSVKRLDLRYGGWWTDLNVPLDSGLVAEDLAAVPGKPNRVAVSRKNTCCSPRHAGVAVYEGWYGKLPSATAGHIGSNVIEFGARGSTLYGMDNESTENRWRTMGVDDGGVEITSNGWRVGLNFYSDFVFAGGRLYTNMGPVIDTGYNDWAGFFQNLSGAVRPDLKTGRAFFLGDDAVIRVGDINTFATMASIAVPALQFEHPATQRRHLVRWGADGLAWHDADQVFILRTPIAGS
jgi:hypothetical protein